MEKVKNMDDLDIIIGLEGGELIVEDFDDLEAIKNVCRTMAGSQGFYGRLLRDIENADLTENDFPIRF